MTPFWEPWRSSVILLCLWAQITGVTVFLITVFLILCNDASKQNLYKKDSFNNCLLFKNNFQPFFKKSTLLYHCLSDFCHAWAKYKFLYISSLQFYRMNFWILCFFKHRSKLQLFLCWATLMQIEINLSFFSVLPHFFLVFFRYFFVILYIVWF